MSGKVVSLDSVLMGVKGNAVRELVLRSSLDGFATDIGSVMFSTTAQNRTMTFETPLMFTSPVEFRFIVKGVLNNGSRYALTSRNDGAGATAGLVFNGTVAAVPEPSSLALLGIVAAGTGGMTMWRRRNRRVAAATS